MACFGPCQAGRPPARRPAADVTVIVGTRGAYGTAASADGDVDPCDLGVRAGR